MVAQRTAWAAEREAGLGGPKIETAGRIERALTAEAARQARGCQGSRLQPVSKERVAGVRSQAP
jgi:hypothetical protein